ncbi:NFACT family protein [Candidatus Micrarchaeota archaeon]|nr:NFACT family protein [Candidatus Micrarchaeota archaeon]
MALSNLDCFYLVRELSALFGQPLQKAFAAPPVFRFKFKSTNFVVHVPDAAFATEAPPVFDAHPGPWAMRLRKLVKGRLVRVAQVGFDRILRLDFPGSSVVFELFADGNVLVLDENGVIVLPLRRETYAARTLSAKTAYQAPPMDKMHPAEFDAAKLPVQGSLISALSKCVNLSPLYLEEAILRAGLNKVVPVTQLLSGETQALEASLSALLDQPLDARVYFKNGEPFFAAPFALWVYRDLPCEPVASFSAGLQRVFSAGKTVDVPAALAEKRKHAVGVQQREALARFGEQAAEARQKAEWILKNATLVEWLKSDASLSEKDVEAAVPNLRFTRKKNEFEFDF